MRRGCVDEAEGYGWREDGGASFVRRPKFVDNPFKVGSNVVELYLSRPFEEAAQVFLDGRFLG